jgi:H+-transporting ATPase
VETILFALILTVAAIPVALPAVLSVTMAVGANTLARVKAIVSRLVSIEEMAGMDVLCSDKTGTLTKNELVVGDPALVHAKDTAELVLCAALASRLDQADDPIDAAVLSALGDRNALKDYATIRFEPFDPVRKRTEAEIEFEGKRFHVAKGAPQVILDLASPDEATRLTVEGQVASFAESGYRTLGVA